MQTETYQHEITFASKAFEEETKQFVSAEVTKAATFLELDKNNKAQHKLHFKIATIFSGGAVGEEDGKAKIDSDVSYDITVKAVKILLVVDEKFTAAEKEEFLNDSSALLLFSLWFMKEKMFPFFQILMPT